MSAPQLPSISDLTDRQRQVFDLLAKGLSNPEIAAVLGIGVATVKTHVTRIFELLDVSTRAEAAGLYGGALLGSGPLTQDLTGDARVPGFGPRPAIAVMPFENIGLEDTGLDDPNDLICQGLVEDLIQRLSWWRLFPVLSRSSTWSYAGHRWNLRRVGRELGVAYCVEGSMRRGADRFYVTANLVETSSGNQVWSDRYEAASAELLTVQAEISEAIAASLYPNLLHSEVDRHRELEPAELDGWQAALRGLWQLEQPQTTLASNDHAFSLFDHAIAADSHFVLPHYGRALAYNQRLINGWSADFSQLRENLDRAAADAHAIDPGDPRSLSAQGIALGIQGDTSGAAAMFHASEAANPSDVMTLHFLTTTLGLNLINGEAAVEHGRRAVRLSRRSPLQALYLSSLGVAYLAVNQYDDAIACVEESLALAPDAYGCAVIRAVVYAVAADGKGGGDEKAAQRAVDEIRGLRPEIPEDTVREFLAASAGPLLEAAEPGLARVDWAG